MRICFFADLSKHHDRREMLRRVEFYHADLTILRDLGHTVVEATTVREIDLTADLYFCWWWAPAIVPVLIGRLRGKPVLVTGAFDYATCRAELPGACYLDRPRWQRASIAAVLRWADASLFVSRYEYEEVTRHLAVRRPWLVPHSVDTDVYRPEPHSPFASDFFFAVAWTSVGNVIRKGVAQSLRAFAQVAKERPELKFVLAGKPGDGHEALQALIRDLGVAQQVEFAGIISLERKLDYFRRCLGYVQPSLYEGFGLAIAEAAATGCPIVSCARGAVPEVAGPDAIFVEPSDEAGLARAMALLAGRERVYEQEQARHDWLTERYHIDKRRQLISEVVASVC